MGDHPPRLSAPEVLAKLKPAFTKDGIVTAANSSAINDGAAALVLSLIHILSSVAGTAAMKGPKKGMTLVTPMMTDTSSALGNLKMMQARCV